MQHPTPPTNRWPLVTKILVWGITFFMALVSINDVRLYFIERLPTRYTLSIENGYKDVKAKELPIAGSSISATELLQKFYANTTYRAGIDGLLKEGHTATEIAVAFRNKAIDQDVTVKEVRSVRYRWNILWIVLLAPATYLILDLLAERVILPLIARKQAVQESAKTIPRRKR